MALTQSNPDVKMKVITWTSSVRTPIRHHTEAGPVEDHYKLTIEPLIVDDLSSYDRDIYSIHTLYRNGERISRTKEVNRLFKLLK